MWSAPTATQVTETRPCMSSSPMPRMLAERRAWLLPCCWSNAGVGHVLVAGHPARERSNEATRLTDALIADHVQKARFMRAAVFVAMGDVRGEVQGVARQQLVFGGVHQ